jgi:hypothetical protein
MATPIQIVRIAGKTAGSDLTTKLVTLANFSIANAFRYISNWFQGVGEGSRSFNGFVISGGTQAFDTVTFSSFVATNTVTINGVVLTGRASPTLASEFKIGANDTETAKNLAAVVNGLGSFGNPPAKVWGVVTAVASGVTVLITALDSGAIGNLYTLAISANGSVTGANFAGGVDGTIIALAKGI